jgi:pimeloyl-ACP methyl ester carboxylesterase
MKRWWIWLLVFLGVGVLVGGGFVLIQVISLQPPVQEANFNERRKHRAYKETAAIAEISSYTKGSAGQAGIYSAPARDAAQRASRAVLVMLPDLGTGAWSFEPWMSALTNLERHAVSYRGMLGASAATQATIDGYRTDAISAIQSVRQNRKIVLLGQGLGALFAVQIARDHPDWIDRLILVAPYVPRQWSDAQTQVARFMGSQVYNGVYDSADNTANFWRDNFGNGIVQIDLEQKYFEKYAKLRQPFEFRNVLEDALFDPFKDLQGAYTALERAAFPVLHIAARYDTSNPIGAQRRLRENLARQLGSRYWLALLNSGKYVSLDWKWQKAASLIDEFIARGRLLGNIIENEEALDPLTEPPDK